MIFVDFNYTNIEAQTYLNGIPSPASATSAVVWRNGASTIVSVSIAHVSSGRYHLSFTTPNDWDVFDHVVVIFTATLGGQDFSSIVFDSFYVNSEGGVPCGDGDIEFQICLKNRSGLPIVGATVVITTDFAGNNIVGGPQLTDSNGVVTFSLIANSTYYRWAQHATTNFNNPKQFVVGNS